MSNQEEIFSYFKRKAEEIIYKYAIQQSSPSYGNQYLRMSCYFGDFNLNMIELEKDLNTETAHILCNYVNDDMDIADIINNLSVYSQNAKLQYITQMSHPSEYY